MERLKTDWLTMSEWLYVDSQPRCDAGVGFMYGPSYLVPSYNNLCWAAHSLTWPWLLSVCHWGDLIRGEAARIPLGWKIEIRGAERERSDRGKWPLTFDSPSTKLCYSSELKSSSKSNLFKNVCFMFTIIKATVKTTVCDASQQTLTLIFM